MPFLDELELVRPECKASAHGRILVNDVVHCFFSPTVLWDTRKHWWGEALCDLAATLTRGCFHQDLMYRFISQSSSGGSPVSGNIVFLTSSSRLHLRRTEHRLLIGFFSLFHQRFLFQSGSPFPVPFQIDTAPVPARSKMQGKMDFVSLRKVLQLRGAGPVPYRNHLMPST